MSNAATYENGLLTIKTPTWQLMSAIVDVASAMALNTTASDAHNARIRCNPRQYTRLLGKLRAEKLVD